MRDPNKNKMAGVNSRFASVSELEILRIQEDGVPENTKKAIKFDLKFSKSRKYLPTSNFRAVSGHVLDNHRFHQRLSKPDRQVAPHPTGAEMNTARFIGGRRKCYSSKHLHKYSGECLCARKHSIFTAFMRRQYNFTLILR